MSLPEIHLYTICWDEADMLGFFFRHYDPWVTRYVIYDDGSTDGSREILAAHPKVELRTFERTDPKSFVLSHQTMQNTAWKESRGSADWIVITAIDEHLHIPGRAMRDYLIAQAAAGVTLVPALGFDMNAPDMPDDTGLLTERVTRGRARIAFNKLSIFAPSAVEDPGFGPGRHLAEPKGRLILPKRDEVMLWHYKHLGFERNAEREANQRLRLGETDLANRLGQHYLMSRAQLRTFWDEMEAQSTDLAVAGFEPERASVKPLWWCNRPDISRTLAKGETRTAAIPVAAIALRPKVSVLLKCYNHAPYVRQSVESVLGQTFQDFELVVTDDGSTDATPDILRSFDDPRIKLDVLPANIGISGAMNATIGRAQGTYLAILNSDDFALPHRLQRQVDYLDSNADVALVFSLPRVVDENGEPTVADLPFEDALAFPDFTRRTWLRYFFFEHNVLCAPTAMIRRDSYERVGLYDRRLTNMQDFDMWIRMLVAGNAIHVMAEELTAFRLRNNHANMSAPRRDTRLRCGFEMTHILSHFAGLSAADFEDIFGADTPQTAGLNVQSRLAELALRSPARPFQYFALQTLRNEARSDEEFIRLRDLSGSIDMFGSETAHEAPLLHAELERARAELKQLKARAASKSFGLSTIRAAARRWRVSPG